jgi:threonine/homoserine/homoserine lactone efflux protein
VEVGLFVRGMVIGFSIAAPVGPIGVLCIRRTLAAGRLAGLVSGLGAATADAVYGCTAAFGLTFVSGLLVSQQAWLRLVGGVFLCYLGLRTFSARPAVEDGDVGDTRLATAYASTFFLTLTNPMTILAFAAVFAGLGVGASSGGYAGALLTVCGVFCGSALWWFVLSYAVSLLRRQIDPPKMMLINRISGIIIMGFGVLALFSIVPSVAGLLS